MSNFRSDKQTWRPHRRVCKSDARAYASGLPILSRAQISLTPIGFALKRKFRVNGAPTLTSWSRHSPEGAKPSLTCAYSLK